jgi:hypothetical protein
LSSGLSYELFWLRLRHLLLFGLLFNPLNTKLLSASPLEDISVPQEVVFDSFFKDLFENTTTGYVLYGEKPIDLEVFRNIEKTIPGSDERKTSVIGLIALKYWREFAPDIKDQNYLLVDFPTQREHEVMFINRKSFLNVVKKNALLFQYKLGIDITPENLLERLIQNGFSSELKENIALQGIVLGYGAENSISYEAGKTLLQRLEPKISPPYQSTASLKSADEVQQEIKTKNWAKNVPDLVCYRSTKKNDRVKIPFNYLKNSKVAKELLNEYKNYQNRTDLILREKNFLSQVLKRLGIKKVASQKVSKYEFFNPEEIKALPVIVAQAIKNTFPNQISSSFIEGMKGMGDKPEKNRIEFLDILWKRDELGLEQTQKFLSQRSLEKDVECLIPGKLYTRTLKRSDSDKKLNRKNSAIKVQYLMKDLAGNPLVGSYPMQEPVELRLSALIPGFSHGMIGMKEGEIREIFIHPDFAYGTSSSFGEGQAVQIIVELLAMKEEKKDILFPFLKPYDVFNYAPDISSCAEYNQLEQQHAYICGLRSWNYYKKAEPLFTLDQVLIQMAQGEEKPLTSAEENLLLKLEWFLQFHSL